VKVASLIAAVIGAGASVGLFLNASRTTPPLLRILLGVWILAPFVALAWANLVSKHWSVLSRTALYCVTIIVALGASAFYDGLISTPTGSPRGFVFVAVPAGSWLLTAIVVLIAALLSTRRLPRSQR